MSSVWAGWLRRLRKGQAEGRPDETGPDAEAEVAAADDEPGAQHGAPTPDIPPEPVPEPQGDPSPEPQGDPVPEPPGVLARETRQTARALLCKGRLREALDAIGDEHDRALAEAIAEGERALSDLGIAAALDGAALGGIMLAPAGKARALILVFGDDAGGFALPRALSRGRSAHLLFVRDTRRCLAMLGVPRLGTDYDACLLAVLRVARHLGARDLFCVGGGMAAYSALRFGLDLGANGVLALGTLTRLDRGATPAGLGPARQVARLLRVAGELGADLAAAYAHATTRPGLVLCRPHPGALADLAALPGVVAVEASPDAPPALLAWADEGGQLRGMLRDLLACRPTERDVAG